MLLLHDFLKKRLREMKDKGVRLLAIGDTGRLPERTRKLLERSIEQTAGNTKINLVLALSYGSRAEIAGAARKIAQKSPPGNSVRTPSRKKHSANIWTPPACRTRTCLFVPPEK